MRIKKIFEERGVNSLDIFEVSAIKAFDHSIKSETVRMLFDNSLVFWHNAPDYIADEYRRERLAAAGRKTSGQNGIRLRRNRRKDYSQ